MDGLREEYRLSLLVIICQLNCWLVKGAGEHTVMMQSQSNPHSSQKKKDYSNINKQTKKKQKKRTKRYPLKYSAGSFVLEGIVWSGDAHEERVVSGVFAAVIHEVCRGLGYLRKHWNLVALFTHDRQQFNALRNKLYSRIKKNFILLMLLCKDILILIHLARTKVGWKEGAGKMHGLLLCCTFILSMLASNLSCCTVRRAWVMLLELWAFEDILDKSKLRKVKEKLDYNKDNQLCIKSR